MSIFYKNAGDEIHNIGKTKFVSNKFDIIFIRSKVLLILHPMHYEYKLDVRCR